VLINYIPINKYLYQHWKLICVNACYLVIVVQRYFIACFERIGVEVGGVEIETGSVGGWRREKEREDGSHSLSGKRGERGMS
jgi:hypothetical protein